MNILLTGGAGYIGSHVAVVLMEAGHEVTLYDNFSNSQPDVTHKIEKIVGRKVCCVEGDILDQASLERISKERCINAVIHLAGLKSVGESVTTPLDYYKVNISGFINVLEVMKKLEIHTLVFSSSATVYGNPAYLPIDEAHPKEATNPYGRTKLQCEEILQDLAQAYPYWKIACLRYFNPIGAHQSGMIGEKPKGTPNNLMPYIAQVASGLQRSLKVFGNNYPTQDGTGVRDYIHVMDLAEGHLAALEYLKSNEGFNPFNLGTGKGYSVFEIIKAFEAASSKKIPFELCERRSGDVAACYSTPRLSEEKLGWSAKRDLDVMCSDHWRWQQHITESNTN